MNCLAHFSFNVKFIHDSNLLLSSFKSTKNISDRCFALINLFFFVFKMHFKIDMNMVKIVISLLNQMQNDINQVKSNQLSFQTYPLADTSTQLHPVCVLT